MTQFTTRQYRAFAPRRLPTMPVDPCPHALTDAQREYLLDRLSCGANPSLSLVRKLLRLCDERLEIINFLTAKLPLADGDKP